MGNVFFLDFDGTICKKDVVAEMVYKFCRPGWREINERWERGELSTEDCAQLTFRLMDATWHDVLQLVNSMELDDYFPEFVKLCQRKKYPIHILSDGYVELIKPILQRYGLHWLPVYANHLQYENGLFNIQCLKLNDQCAKCGTCKVTLLNQLRQNKRAIYVGDGYSDMCVCQHADLVFAKDALWDYCIKNQIAAHHYESFKDIIQWLK